MPTKPSKLIVKLHDASSSSNVTDNIALRDAWKAQVHLSILILLSNALATGSAGPLVIGNPDEPTVGLLKVSIEVETVVEGDERIQEGIVTVEPLTHNSALTDLATRVALTAIEPEATAWTAAPLKGVDMAYRVLFSDESRDRAWRAKATGTLEYDEMPDAVRLGTVAHYAPTTGLTDATVDGEPVQAMCGYWFVPMHDHEPLQICNKCTAAREGLPA